MIGALLTVALMAVASAEPTNLLAKTTLGPVQGHLNELGMPEWKGIPYARPPMGELRWQDPQSPEAWAEVYNANVNVQGCPQDCNLPPGNCPIYGTGEDCLYLNVFAPVEASTDPAGYPVLFWIHGGAYEQGLGNCALYNGTTFAQHDVITVVINYRLGALGFMASESMAGNYGTKDQRLALQWTHDNVKSFGGNPDRVTIAGQSAGAMSVGIHLTSPNSQGLFANSVQESNPLGLPFHTRESAGANAKSVFEYLGCTQDDVACMMTKTADEVVDAQNHAVELDLNSLLLNFLPFAPMVEPGSKELPEQPLVSLAAGALTTVGPMLQGTMTDEGQLFVYELFTSPLSEVAYKIVVDGIFGVKAGKELLEAYPYDIVPGSVDGREALNVLATDLIFYCPLRNVTQGYERAMGDTAAPTYVYQFKHVLSFDCWGPDYQFCVDIVCHGSELPFVFNVFSDGVSIDYTPNADEVALTTDVNNAWTNFITNSDPNKGLPVSHAYPRYVPVTDELIVLDEPEQTTAKHLRDSYCDMWDRLGYFY